MGTKINITYLLLLSLVLSGCATNRTLFYKEAKGVALCRCIMRFNSPDSMFIDSNDYSQSYFIEYSNMSPLMIHQINKYVDSTIIQYRLTPREIGGNMNGLACWRLYESRELKQYIKELYRTRRVEWDYLPPRR